MGDEINSIDEDSLSERYKYPTYRMPASRISIHANNHWSSTKRVIAPYVTMTRKGTKAVLKRDDQYYNFYLSKKSSALMRNLKSYISSRHDLPALLNETGGIIRKLTNSLGMRLYLVDNDTNELYQYQKNVTYPKCRVNYDIESGNSIACYVARTKEYVMVDDVTKDDRFPDGVSYKENVKPALCIPIITYPHTYAVLEFYRDMNAEPYKKNELKLAVLISGWIGLTITENLEGAILHRQRVVNANLLNITMAYFGDKFPLECYLTETLNYAKRELDAEKGCFYVMYNESEADVYEESISDSNNRLIKKKLRAKFGNEQTVACHVAKTFEMMNVRDLVNDSRFRNQSKMDQDLPVIERTEICTPIVNDGILLGIISIVNKSENRYFNFEDESMMGLISTYAGMALQFARIKRQLEETQLHITVTTELLQYHLKPCEEQLEKFKEEISDVPIPKNIKSFGWYIFPEDIKLLPHLTIHFMVEIVGLEHIDMEKLYAFVLTTQNSYRNNPYHNFEHGFNVTHAMYTILIRNQDKFSLLEKQSLMVAALTHDIDHTGVNNNYLLITNHYLSQLYSDAIWENHHYFVTAQLLRKFKFFKNLTKENFEEFLDLVKGNILATDLVMMFKTRNKIVPLIKSREFNLKDPYHRSLARNIMMTTCDLSGLTKAFSIAKRLMDRCYREFYHQGDLEKGLGYTPVAMLDRNNECHIPDDQAQFSTIIVMTTTDLLRTILPNTEEIYLNAEQLRDTWKRIIQSRGEKLWHQCDSLRM